MTIQVGILNDTTLCTGCERCVEACRKENELEPDLPRPWKQSIDDLSSTRFTKIERREGNHFVRRFCRHCRQPACVSACIVGALQKTAEGPVIYDSSKCIGCRYCIMSCPYGIPRYDWESSIPYVRKCILCYPRILAGKLPACVEACPEKATIFGPREDLIREARRRIKESPDRYLHAVVGETEVGGTSVLYISDISLGFLGYGPELDSKPLPALTWAALSKVPPLILGMGGLMTGIYWIIERRMKRAAESARHSGSPGERGDGAS
jgi:formate dehydrogenase iron-sulfur subunit